MIGLSCASFAHLSGGDMTICAITFIASAIAMFVRQEISKRHYIHSSFLPLPLLSPH